MLRVASRCLVTALMLAVTASSFAATYIVPADADLIRAADSIAVVTIQSSHSYYTEGGSIATDYTAVVERSLKAAPGAGSTIVLTQQGGFVGTRGLMVTSEPQFAVGERALVMLRATAGGLTTLTGQLGKFDLVTDASARELIVRGTDDEEITGWDTVTGAHYAERTRDAAAFLRYIEAVVAGGDPVADYVVENAATPRRRLRANTHVSGNDYMTMFNDGVNQRGARWPDGSFGMKRIGTQTGVGDLEGAIGSSRGAWNGTGTSINIGFDGVATG